MDVNLGLVNNAKGVVVDIVKNLEDPDEPDILLVKIEGFKGNELLYDINGNPIDNVIAIKPIRETVNGITRVNYPLDLAFSNTIHFSQGSTTNYLVLFCGKMFNRNSELL